MRRSWTPHALLAILAEPTPQMAQLRTRLTHAQGRCPSRRTWERRLARLAGCLPLLIALLGTWLLQRLTPWPHGGRAVALDSPTLRADGGVWRKKQREAGSVPHTSIGTEAGWTKSGWHGWVYGWKLQLIVTVSESGWLPLAAELTPANVADNEVAGTTLADSIEDIRTYVPSEILVGLASSSLVGSWCRSGRIVLTARRSLRRISELEKENGHRRGCTSSLTSAHFAGPP